MVLRPLSTCGPRVLDDARGLGCQMMLKSLRIFNRLATTSFSCTSAVFLICVALLFKFLFALFVRFCLLVKSLAFVCLFKRLSNSFNSGRLSRILTATAEKNMDQEAQGSF